MSLNRAFTKTEKLLLLILAIALLCLCYYRFVFVPVQDRIAAADTAPLEDELTAEQMKASQIQTMQQEIAENQGNETGVVQSYDNFTAEANALNAIFQAASTFNFSFSQPIADGDAVRRSIGIDFTASDYQVAHSIIQQIHDCPFRCLIRDINITAQGVNGAQGSANVSNSPVSVSLNVTFFETLYDAKTTTGLDYAQGSEQKQNAGGLANADVSDIQRSDLETAAESIAAGK